MPTTTLPLSAAATRQRMRTLLATTPPPTASLVPTVSEDRAAMRLYNDGCLSLPRLDLPGASRVRGRSEHSDVAIGAIRLFDRDIITLDDPTEPSPVAEHLLDEATWTWAMPHGESDGLRLISERHTSGFFVYNLAYRKVGLRTMSAARLGALLGWHLRGTSTVRVDIDHTDRARLPVLTHHRPDGTAVVVPLTAPAPDPRDLGTTWESFGRNVNPHLDRGLRLPDALLTAVCCELADRAQIMFATPHLTMDVTTWRLHSAGWAPGVGDGSSFSETFSHDLRLALAVFDAPTFATQGQFLGWADEALQVTVVCRDSKPVPGEPRPAGRRHTLRLVASTGEVVTVNSRNAAQVEDLDAIHFLAALRRGGTETRCLLVRHAWQGDGVLPAQERFAPALCDRVQAAHRIHAHVASLLG